MKQCIFMYVYSLYVYIQICTCMYIHRAQQTIPVVSMNVSLVLSISRATCDMHQHDTTFLISETLRSAARSCNVCKYIPNVHLDVYIRKNTDTINITARNPPSQTLR